MIFSPYLFSFLTFLATASVDIILLVFKLKPVSKVVSPLNAGRLRMSEDVSEHLMNV